MSAYVRFFTFFYPVPEHRLGKGITDVRDHCQGTNPRDFPPVYYTTKYCLRQQVGESVASQMQSNHYEAVASQNDGRPDSMVYE